MQVVKKNTFGEQFLGIATTSAPNLLVLTFRRRIIFGCSKIQHTARQVKQRRFDRFCGAAWEGVHLCPCAK
jgi:hypothetical protein